MGSPSTTGSECICVRDLAYRMIQGGHEYCVFSLNFVICLNSASSAEALVFYLPSVCTHTDAEGKQRKARVRKYFKIFGKNTIFNEHPVHLCIDFVRMHIDKLWKDR